MALPDGHLLGSVSGAKARERRVVVGGALIVVIALSITYAVLPFARRWSARESAIDAAALRVEYLEGLVARSSELETLANTREQALSNRSVRVLHARSSTLAASAMQSWLQDAADASRLVVTRLEIAPDTSASAETGSVPATLSAYGDITGVASLLDVLQHGPRVMSIERLTLQRNSALLGAADVVQATISVRAPVLPP